MDVPTASHECAILKADPPVCQNQARQHHMDQQWDFFTEPHLNCRIRNKKWLLFEVTTFWGGW